jgi:hypothetical protein
MEAGRVVLLVIAILSIVFSIRFIIFILSIFSGDPDNYANSEEHEMDFDAWTNEKENGDSDRRD